MGLGVTDGCPHPRSFLRGRTNVLGGRYGRLAVPVRSAGGSLFDFETDELAREVTLRNGAGDQELCRPTTARAGA